jgi:hypothetical protein
VLAAPTPRGVADALMERWLAADWQVSAVRDRLVTVANGEETV